MSINDEVALIKRAQQGDDRAFEQLYEQYYRMVYTYIYYRVNDQALAEDLTSDVFVKMVTKIDSFQPKGKPFVAWLYTIAGNLVRNSVKRRGRFTWLPLSDQDEDGGESLMSTIARKLNREMLTSALNKLTEDQRQVIILRFLNGQPIATVARLIGKTETSVKALQRRAIKSLRRELEKEGFYVEPI